MATLPTIAELTGATTTNAQQKTNFSTLRNYLSELLGTNSGDKVAARQALGIGLQSGAILNLTANIALTASLHLGKTLVGQSPIDFSVVLPSASTCFAGARISFPNLNLGILFLNRAGTDTITTGITGRTVVGIGSGDTLTVESNGVNAWVAVEGSALLKDSKAFASSTGATPFNAFPSGNLIQSGSGNCDAGGGGYVTFPRAFLTSAPKIVVTPLNGSFTTFGFNINNRSATGFSVLGSSSNTSVAGLGFSWIAFDN